MKEEASDEISKDRKQMRQPGHRPPVHLMQPRTPRKVRHWSSVERPVTAGSSSLGNSTLLQKGSFPNVFKGYDLTTRIRLYDHVRRVELRGSERSVGLFDFGSESLGAWCLSFCLAAALRLHTLQRFEGNANEACLRDMKIDSVRMSFFDCLPPPQSLEMPVFFPFANSFQGIDL